MLWHVWNSFGEMEAGERWIDAPDCVEASERWIDASDCVEAAEEWARRDGAADPMSIHTHLRSGLDLRARADGTGTVYRIVVKAEAVVNYYGTEGW